MNCVLFAKMDQVFSLKNKTLKNTGKLEKKWWKSQVILSVRKSGKPDLVNCKCEQTLNMCCVKGPFTPEIY